MNDNPARIKRYRQDIRKTLGGLQMLMDKTKAVMLTQYPENTQSAEYLVLIPAIIEAYSQRIDELEEEVGSLTAQLLIAQAHNGVDNVAK